MKGTDCCCPIFQAEGQPRRTRFLARCPTHAPDSPPAVRPNTLRAPVRQRVR